MFSWTCPPPSSSGEDPRTHWEKHARQPTIAIPPASPHPACVDTQTLITLLLLSSGAGLSIFVGALLAKWCTRGGMEPNAMVQHSVLAFGGGALVSAVGLVLAPDGLGILPVWVAAALFVAGGAVFAVVDRVLHARGTPLSQVVATLLDFVPEAIVLGAVIVDAPAMAVALAVLIAAQNLPEGFAAYLDIARAGSGSALSRHPLAVLGACVVVGPLAALFGYYVCGQADPALGVIMLFCAGGILLIVFRDIAPRANLERSVLPSLAAVAGFAVGLVGLGVAH